MSIEVGSKWVKDGEVVRVFRKEVSFTSYVWFEDSKSDVHVLTEHDLLKQYKPYEPVYEYQYAFRFCKGICVSSFYTEKRWEELKDEVYFEDFQRLDFTKRERT